MPRDMTDSDAMGFERSEVGALCRLPDEAWAGGPAAGVLPVGSTEVRRKG